ncbi:MAG: type II toxin-antitoxin system RelE/ParE family toxin [Gemmataceae bacterium]
MIPYLLHPEAEQELANAVAWCEVHYPPRLSRFHQEVTNAMTTICEHPTAMPIEFDPDVRVRMLPLLPYHWVYTWDGQIVRFLAFAHNSRRPGYWTNRLAARPTETL